MSLNYHPGYGGEGKSAVVEIVELSGYHLRKDATEKSYTIEDIVEDLAPQTSSKVLHSEEYLCGIDFAVEEVYQNLSMEANDVHAIGICGMPGVGKATTAKVLYNKYSKQFDISYFFENVKQYSQGGSPLLPLLEHLLVGILKRKDCKVPDVESRQRQLKQILCSKKTLIVLDDLDQSSYLEFLLRVHNLFSAESRIIITTRYADLIRQIKVDLSEADTYMVKKLGPEESLELFSYHAFGKSLPSVSFNFHRALSKRCNLCLSLSLALKVLVSSLRGRTHLSCWEAELEKVRETENDINKTLQLSYDESDDEEVSIFIDIAFFFVGKDKDETAHIFKFYDYCRDVRISVLVERCLLRIDEDNKFQMHNLIQDM